ncbi:MAG: hypothetical protein AAFU41_13725 [Pseudomonadota bacterium]
MRYLWIPAALAGLAACDSGGGGSDTSVDAGAAAQFALNGAFVTITYNADTDVYLIKPVDDEAARIEGNPTFDRGGFDLAGVRTNGQMLVTQSRGNS